MLQSVGIKTVPLGQNRAHFIESASNNHAAPILHHGD